MPDTQYTSASAVDRSGLLFPLDALHQRAGRSVPSAIALPPEALPEPQRSLLVHERDMTRTLEQFHRGTIHLELLSCHQEDGAYWREVVLRLDGSEKAVEFGATRIVLDQFDEPWRSQIVEGYRPLGGILNARGIRYRSSPDAYFSITSDPYVTQALGLQGSPTLYGRRNRLRSMEGELLAEIVEILPPQIL